MDEPREVVLRPDDLVARDLCWHERLTDDALSRGARGSSGARCTAVVAFDGPGGARCNLAVRPRFFCDAMLGGLSRWLRAAGYDTSFEHGIDDGKLVRVAAEEGRIVLSSDGGIFERKVVKSGSVRAVHVPRATSPIEQLAFVFRVLDLTMGEPRCMACGGELREVAKRDVAAIAPARSFAAYDRFWVCASCAKLYWHGTHWTRIAGVIDAVARSRHTE